MTLLLVYIGVALGFSFLCSILEAAILSFTPGYVARLRQERPAIGNKLHELKADVDKPLAAILTLNTIAHTMGAAGAGAQAEKLWGSDILTIASIILTLLILVFSEIIPKTLGAVYWRKLGGFVARVMPPMIAVLFPLVWLSEKITSFIKRNRGKEKISREDFAALARVGEEQGVFDESESRILRNLFHFGNLRARDIMTPRTVVFALDENTTVGAAIAHRGSMVFSRVPVYRGPVDHVVGYVLKDQLLLRAARDEQDTPIRDMVREVLMVPDTLLLPALFERLLDKREHIAVVVDEHGGFDGVVTMEDVLETLIGLEIVDEMDPVKDMRAMARAKWRARAKRLKSTSGLPAVAADDPELAGEAASSDDGAS